MAEPFTFVQVSDTHLEANPRAIVHGVSPYVRLEACVEHIRALKPRPAFALFTGDLVNDDDPTSYEHVRKIASWLDLPVHYAVGNHDVRLEVRRVLLEEDRPSEAPLYYAFSHEGVRFFVLDSQVPGEIAGALDDEQLDWLASELSAQPTAPSFVVLHHPPAPAGIAWLDEHTADGGDRLLELLSRAPGVRAVLFGHVHMPVSMLVSGVHLLGVPSTGYQFGDEVNTPKVYGAPGAYRVVRLEGDRVSTWLNRFDLGNGHARA